MYCNYSVAVNNSVTAVVTELDCNPDKPNPVSIKAGYAFNKANKPVEFWSLVNYKFVTALIEKYNLQGERNEQSV